MSPFLADLRVFDVNFDWPNASKAITQGAGTKDSTTSRIDKHSSGGSEFLAVPICAIVFTFIYLIIKAIMAPFTQRAKYARQGPGGNGGGLSQEEIAVLQKPPAHALPNGKPRRSPRNHPDRNRPHREKLWIQTLTASASASIKFQEAADSTPSAASSIAPPTASCSASSAASRKAVATVCAGCVGSGWPCCCSLPSAWRKRTA